MECGIPTEHQSFGGNLNLLIFEFGYFSYHRIIGELTRVGLSLIRAFSYVSDM